MTEIYDLGKRIRENSPRKESEMTNKFKALDIYPTLSDEELQEVNGGRLEFIANYSNGYLYYNTSTHKYGYQVTMDPVSAVGNTISTGFGKSMGGGWWA